MQEPCFNTSFALPEIERRDLRPDIVARAIATHGAIIVRHCLPADIAWELDACAQKSLAELDKPADQRDPAWFHPKQDVDLRRPRAFAVNDGCALMLDCPGTLKRTIDVYRETGLLSFLSEYLGAAPMLSRYKATLRRARPHNIAAACWHQDGSFMGTDMRTLNVWLALTECGERAASVEVATKRFDTVVPCDLASAVSDEKVRTLEPNSVIPVCSPGDALMFDQFCLHRTSRADYPDERRALEMWFFEPASYPHAYDPAPIQL